MSHIINKIRFIQNLSVRSWIRIILKKKTIEGACVGEMYKEKVPVQVGEREADKVCAVIQSRFN